MKVRNLMRALMLSLTLALCGCAFGGGAQGDGTDAAEVEVSPSYVAHAKPECSGWVDDVFAYCKEHADPDGVLVEVTGLITKGSAEGVEKRVTLVSPTLIYDEESEDMDIDPMAEIEVPDDADRVEVNFAESIKMTKWTHLTTVRGMAFYDSSEPHLLVLKSAMKSKG